MLEYCILYNSSSVVPDFHSMACYGVLYSDAVDQRHFVSLLESLATSQYCTSEHYDCGIPVSFCLKKVYI